MIVTRVTIIVDLNDYEWRAYRALLAVDSATAYELGKRSGIPLSRCYEVARALAAKGAALVQPGDPPRYRAAEPDELVARERRQLDELGDDLRALRAERDRVSREPVWVVHGREAILSHAAALIERAASGVDLRAPVDAIDALALSLASARARLVSIATHATDPLLLLVDDADALLGDLEVATHLTQPAVVALLASQSTSRDWQHWERAKLRRLLPNAS